jgi:ABC-2 type transport system ATP-binding protein
MIEVQNLSKSYGDIHAIKSLTFKVNKGEVVGFLGPNGAGKSTTMKIMTGFMAPTSGKAIIAGFDVFENPIEVKKRIGYLPETPPVYGDMRVEEYLEYVARLKGVEKTKLKKNVNMALEKTNLGSVRRRLIHHLSKGFKQRVGVAQALVSDPEILILDEPTVGLDPKQVAEIRDLIKDLKGHHTIILSTHILPEVQASCERIIIINKGEIVAQDSLSNLAKLQAGTRSVHLKVARGSPELVQNLKSVAGVRAVVPGAGQNIWQVEIDDREEIIEKIAEHVIAKNLGLLEIHSAKADLEDIFMKLTYGSEGAQP